MAADFFFFPGAVSSSLSFTYTATAIWGGVRFLPQGNAYEMWQIILCITAVRKPRLNKEKKQK